MFETKPSGDLWVCLVTTDLNKAILCDNHPIPDVLDIMPELGGSDLFSRKPIFLTTFRKVQIRMFVVWVMYIFQ